MKLAEIELPREVAFERPKDFAAYCNESIVRLIDDMPTKNNLEISEENGWLRFSYGIKATEYLIKNILRLQINLFEEVMSWEICTFRVVIKENDGSIVSLPVITNGGTERAWFSNLEQILIDKGVPYEIEVRGKVST